MTPVETKDDSPEISSAPDRNSIDPPSGPPPSSGGIGLVQLLKMKEDLRAYFKGVPFQVSAGMLREKHDGNGRCYFGHAACRLDSVDSWHLKIKDYDVGPQFLKHLNGRDAIRSFATYFPVRVGLQDHAQRSSHQVTVVYN